MKHAWLSPKNKAVTVVSAVSFFGLLAITSLAIATYQALTGGNAPASFGEYFAILLSAFGVLSALAVTFLVFGKLFLTQHLYLIRHSNKPHLNKSMY